MTEFDYTRRFQEIEQHMIDDANARWANEKPADAAGATHPSNGLRTADASGATQPSNGSDPQHSPSRPGLLSTPTEFDRLQKRVGLAEIENEVLRDLLAAAETAVGDRALVARIAAHLRDNEAECGTCDHYVVNHEATGPCAVADCDCPLNAA